MSRTFLKDGRKWQVNSDGINSLTRTYVIQLDTNNLGENSEFINFASYGIPDIGSSHPSFHYLKVLSYSVDEGEGSEKKLIKVICNYGLESEEDGAAEGEENVEQWGWEAGVDTKEVTYNQLNSKEGTLLNSAGDVFESVPVCEYPAPVFVKVIKSKSRKSWLQYNCKLNQNSITIGSMICPQKTLLATVSEQRIFGDPEWNYRYTVQLKYKSNYANLGFGTNPIEYGWDIPIVDCGMRELDSDGKLKVIMQVDQETKKPCAVTSPELLDGEGHVVKREEGTKSNPYIIRVQAYEIESFPSEMYSEPNLN